MSALCASKLRTHDADVGCVAGESLTLRSVIGDGSVRTALYEAAHVILTRPGKGSDLKGWALAVARRAGPKKARVALARKLAVVLHCMLRDRTNFVAHKGASAVAA